MVLEASGRDLGWIELASWLRLTGLLGLLANLTAPWGCLLYTSDAADERSSVDLGGRRIIKKQKKRKKKRERREKKTNTTHTQSA